MKSTVALAVAATSRRSAGAYVAAKNGVGGSSRRPLNKFLLERFDGWNDSTMSLSSSECEPLTLKELLKLADNDGKKLWDELSLGYVEPSSGSEFLKQEILKTQFSNDHRRMDTNCVNVCAPQEGIFLAIQAICNPGDHVIVTAPAYQSLGEVAASIGCDVEEWWPEGVAKSSDSSSTQHPTVNPCFNPATLQQLLRPNKTRLVIANFPHNPTGIVPSSEDFECMAQMIQSNNKEGWFLVDEMYRGLEHKNNNASSGRNSAKTLPAVADLMEHGISLGGVSKSFGLPGLRIGWLVNENAAFQQRVAELKDYTTICPPAPSEALTFIALRAKDQILSRNQNIVMNGLNLLRNFITQEYPHYFHWNEPQGGTFAWVGLHAAAQDDITASQYCAALSKRTGIMIVPSRLFVECKETGNDNRMRLTYGKKGIQQLLQVWKEDLDKMGIVQ